MSYSALQESRKKLPVYQYRDELIKRIKSNPLVLIVGETGSGKSTQIPQYLLSQDFCDRNRNRIVSSRNRIVCTQPRTVAAIGVANRVATEQNCRCGSRVGYQVRLDSKISDNTELIYMTEGSLLRKVMSDEYKYFRGFSCIIIDEAHERTVNADLLMGFLKDTIDNKYRNDEFHVIIMSATLDTVRFLNYFNNPPLIEIPGNLYPITRYFLQQPTDNYINLIVEIVATIHNSNKTGDILIFLTGSQEIDECVELLKNRVRSNNFEAYPLYSQMSKDKQEKAINRMSNDSNFRRCVVSTNIAETSLTIDNVVFVIDCGYSKQKTYVSDKGIEVLGIRPISKASVKQRLGRAGRVRNGFVYHLYTKIGYKSLENETQPEILRSSLVNEILYMFALGIKNPLKFDYIDPPDKITLARALTMLYNLDAISANSGKLTELGKQMAKFPLDPRLGKSILMAKKYNVTNEILSICCMLEIRDKLFRKPRNDSNLLSIYKKKVKLWSHVDGDHLTYLNIFNAYIEKRVSCNHDFHQIRQFCQDNFWDFKSLFRAFNIRKQLERVLHRIETNDDEKENINRYNRNNNNNYNNYKNNFDDKMTIKCLDGRYKKYYENIIKALLSGYYLNICVKGFSDKYWIYTIINLNSTNNVIKVLDKAAPHNSSIFNKHYIRNWLIYHEVVIQHVTQLRCLTAIKPKWLFEVAPKVYDIKMLENDKSAISETLKDIYYKQCKNRHR